MAEATESAAINSPARTDYRKKNSLDPLGMQNSSLSRYQTFPPGISNWASGACTKWLDRAPNEQAM
jgi:hypothetical protein